MSARSKFFNRKDFIRRKQKQPQYQFSQKKSQEQPTFALHGYHGFKLYFANSDGLDVEKTLRNVSAFEKYVGRNEQLFSLSAIKTSRVFFVDLNQLDSDELLHDWKGFETDISRTTKYCLACMGLAVHQLIHNLKTDQDAVIPFINARIANHRPILQFRNIKVNCYNTLVSVRGTVIKASNVRLFCKCLAFSCSSCSQNQLVQQVDGNFTVPTRCPTKGCKAQSNFVPMLSTQKPTVNWQTLKIQEVLGIDSNENGRIPRTIECELTDDLVGCCIPGDDITITGVVEVRNTLEGRQKKNQPSIFSLYMDAISVVNNKNQAEAMTGAEGRIIFDVNDYYAIQKIHAEPFLFRFLVHSLCPNIFGNDTIKAGFLLALFGGTNDSSDDITSTRAVSHVLMVGDPGLGKSHILQACTNVAPRGVYVCGNTSTSSGLTVTMAKDSNGDYSLEAGALILADQGYCCIDEFDKMTNQHSHLLEAMEQQSISIAKAGVTCNLSACTSILAAANPSGGHYNKAKTVSENIKMSSPLISRFDLVFLLLDQPSKEHDVQLSEHVLALHSGMKRRRLDISADESTNEHNGSFLEKLKLQPNESIDYLPHQLFRKYIAYAQKYVHPSLTLEAQDVLQQFYLNLRKNCQLNNSSPITARQLESLLRLTQARAKVELREEATATDAMEVIEIIKHSYLHVFTDESGALDVGRSQNGSGMSKKNQIKKLLLVLQEKAEASTKSIFTYKEIQNYAEEVGITDRFSTTFQNLNFHGYILKRGNDKFQLTSVDFG